MAASELFRSREAQLYVEEGEESALLQSGDFSLVLVKSVVSQLAAVVAMVGAVQWPVGRDCAVIRTGDARFSFSLPGPLSYTLVLRSTASSAADLQSLLQDYSTCSQRPAAPAAGGQEEECSKQADKKVEICSVAGLSKNRSVDDLSVEMVRRMQRARRMSAIAKVFSKSLERGAINVANHVEPMDMVTQDSRSNSLNLALAGVDAVAKVVEAVDTGGRALLESAVSAAAAEPSLAQGSRAHLSDLVYSGWTLNKHGLLMLYRVITASMAIHSGVSSRSGSSRSGSSSSSDFRRLLSSSSSSSSADARGTDATSVAALTPPVAGTAPSPPPLFTSSARMSTMPPPSGPFPPPVPLPFDSLASSSFRIYKPRPTPSSTPPAPPPFLPRPPRFQPPQN